MNNSSKPVLGNYLTENLDLNPKLQVLSESIPRMSSHNHSHEDQIRHEVKDSMHPPVGLRVRFRGR